MAFHRNSKADTVFLSDTASATLQTDLSQYAANLTSAGTYLTSTSSRFRIRSPRSIAVVANLSNTQSGILINHGAVSGVNPNFRISIAAGSVSFIQGASTLATLALPAVGATAASFLLHWSTDFDELDNVWYSELAVCRVASQLWAISRVTHTQPPVGAGTDQLNASGYGAGVSLFSGGLANITKVRIGGRFVTSTEASEDWVVQSSTPSITGHDQAVELAPFNASDFYEDDGAGSISDAILDSGTLAGPAEWLAVLHAGEARQRLYSPLLNVELVSAPILQSTYLPANFHFLESNAALFGNLRYGLHYLWIRSVPVSPKGTLYARVRVQVQTYLAAGSPVGTIPYIGVRLISKGTFLSKPTATGSGYSSLGVCTVNHGSSGGGEWISCGQMPVQTDKFSSGITFLCLGYTMGGDLDTGLTFRRARIKAVVAELYYED